MDIIILFKSLILMGRLIKNVYFAETQIMYRQMNAQLQLKYKFYKKKKKKYHKNQVLLNNNQNKLNDI